MTQRAELQEKIDSLPPQYIGEVIDFLGYLQKKAQQKQVIAGTKWVNPLFGLAKVKGATLTLDRFMEMQKEEINHENENDKRLWNNK